MWTANSRRSWASSFPPTNSADERRYDDVTLVAAPAKATGVSAGCRLGGGPWLQLPGELVEEKRARHSDDQARISFGDGLGRSDADREFEMDTGGGRVLFNLRPRGPWPNPAGHVPMPVVASDGQEMLSGRQPAVLHRMAHTRPLVASPSMSNERGVQSTQWQHELSKATTRIPASEAADVATNRGSVVGNGSKSSSRKGFSLRRLLHIKPSSRSSVSRSRSSASATPSAMTATSQLRPRAPSGGGGGVGVGEANGKSIHPFAQNDTKMHTYQPLQQYSYAKTHQQQRGNLKVYGQTNGSNGIGQSSASAPSASGTAKRVSRYNTEFTMSRPQPAPDYHGV